MRIIAIVMAATLVAPAALGQVALEGSIDSNLRGDLSTGLRGELFSGITGNLGDPRRGRPDPGRNLPEEFVRTGCPPQQASVYNTGCQPIEYLSRDSFGTYERSSQALGPLSGLTLDPSPPGVLTND